MSGARRRSSGAPGDKSGQPRSPDEDVSARTTEALAEHEGMRLVGELGMGIAHDLTSLLAAIAFRLYAIQKDQLCRQQHGENIDAIARIVDDGKRMVARLQALGSRATRALVAVDLVDTIDAAIDIAKSSVRLPAAERGRAVRIRRKLPELPPIAGDPDELQRVFVNLLLNARDAMPDGGTVTIRARRVHAAVVVTVEDEGTGIPADALPRIFDVLFTTKGSGGTGLGLALARSIMHRIGGRISARNRRDGGACFELRFVPFRTSRRRRKPGPVVDRIPDLRASPRRETRA